MERSFCNGKLPSSAPLANAYVPFQEENPPQYNAAKGWIRGTLFPGLDLPFLGMVNQKEKTVTPMTELQTIQFAIQELALFLDTHRNDAEALALYREYQQRYRKCLEKYTEKHGAMNHQLPSQAQCYDWLDDPWPWEFCGNKEV